jgi:hypothetical protein
MLGDVVPLSSCRFPYRGLCQLLACDGLWGLRLVRLGTPVGDEGVADDEQDGC